MSKVKIVCATRSENYIEQCDWRDAIRIEKIKDGTKQQMFLVRDDEPEDSNLSRSFSNCYNVHELIRSAYEAGVAGEEWEFSTEESDNI